MNDLDSIPVPVIKLKRRKTSWKLNKTQFAKFIFFRINTTTSDFDIQFGRLSTTYSLNEQGEIDNFLQLDFVDGNGNVVVTINRLSDLEEVARHLGTLDLEGYSKLYVFIFYFTLYWCKPQST